MSMSRSESGKLGAEKSRVICAASKQRRVDEYNLSPSTCMCCSISLSYEKRRNSFCSHYCGARYSNARKDWNNIVTGPAPKGKTQEEHKHDLIKSRIAPIIHKSCENCGIVKKKLTRFCCRDCQTTFNRKKKIFNWKSGASINLGQIKQYIKDTYGNKCSCCGLHEWNNKPITLEIEHIDGNSTNNIEENLCLLCPNCHSQTKTYKAKNKGNGRHSRRLRYLSGKSY